LVEFRSLSSESNLRKNKEDRYRIGQKRKSANDYVGRPKMPLGLTLIRRSHSETTPATTEFQGDQRILNSE